MKEKVVVGLSGGVDSAVAAYLLKEQGYEVIGINMQVTPKNQGFEEREGGCCSLSDVNDARAVADKLDIFFYVLNFRDIFEKKVIDYFIDDYLKGFTPNPCIACNKHIKFDELLRKAQALGANYIATGHYAKVVKDETTGRYLLLRSNDAKKDQTYVLYNLSQYQLEHTLMPLGSYNKEDARKLALEMGLPVAKKPDSVEICFVPDDNHGEFIKERVPTEVKAGNFIDISGKVLGKHKGIPYYTIGQRKGLGLALGKPVFVLDILPETNTIVIGDEEGIFKTELYAEDVNFIPFESLTKEMEVTAKIRYSAKETEAVISPHKNGVLVKFKNPQRAITRGQSVVFFNGEVVVGGGIIKDIL